MASEEIDEMGPIDYILVEWPDHEAGKARSYWQGMMDAPIAQR